jgi:hypothetical protein
LALLFWSYVIGQLQAGEQVGTFCQNKTPLAPCPACFASPGHVWTSKSGHRAFSKLEAQAWVNVIEDRTGCLGRRITIRWMLQTISGCYFQDLLVCFL